jgi:ribosomal protein S18 acetylase RimI-like enzyme
MESPIRTREFRIDDYEAAVRLWRVVDGVEIAEGDDKNSIASYLERNPGWSRVALADGKIVAVALCGHDGRRGHIYHLAVEPSYQGQGLGKLLVDECLSRLRAAGIQRAIILVAGDNDRGLSFWRRTGWEQIDGAIVMGIDL